MAEQVSETFRQNCYDDTKQQRLVLHSDDLLLSNEDISIENRVRFHISSITSTQQVQFGCTPMNTIDVSILNDDGRIQTDSIVGKEFHCEIGVEVSNDEYLAPASAICAINTGVDSISVHSTAPYVRGNCTFASLLPQLMEGYKCKIMYAYDKVYFVVYDGETTYFAKHTKIENHQYGEYEEPDDAEKADLLRLMFLASYDAIAYWDGGMCEYTYSHEHEFPGEWATVRGSIIHVLDAIEYKIKSWVVGLGMDVPAESGSSGSTDYSTWNDMLSRTWGGVKEAEWGEYSGYSVFNTVRYETLDYGVWTFNRPRRINSAVLTLGGADRMKLFDEDSANFASSMPNSLITMREMIVAIANYKGVPVGNLDGLNALADTKRINPSVYYQNKSLKDLLSYAFEVCGSNCIIDRHGMLSASNSDNTPIPIPYVYVFDVADYTAHTVNKILVYREGDSVEYQEDPTVEDGVTYDWTDNPYFDNILLDGSWFSEGVNKKYGGFRNAITNTDADYSLWADDVYSWSEDGVTYREPIFTMDVEWGGSGIVTYTNYGEEDRQYSSYGSRISGVASTTEVNLQGFNKAKRANRLYFDENGLTVEADGMRILNENGDAVFYADDEGNLTLEGRVEADSGYFGNWQLENGNLSCKFEDSDETEFKIGKNAQDKPFIHSKYTDYDGSVIMSLTDSNGMHVYKNNSQVGMVAFYNSPRSPYFFVGAPESTEETIRMYCSANYIYMQTNRLYIDNSPRIKNLTTSAGSANAVFSPVGSSGNEHYLCISSSLRKYKDNIKTIANASKTVDNLRGVSFTSKCEADDPKQVMFGLIAEEVEKACPELASYTDGKLQGVQYDRVCALLIEDNKACHKRIEELEKRLERLEKRLKDE